MPLIVGFSVASLRSFSYFTSGSASRYQGFANVPHQVDVSLLEAIKSLVTRLSEGNISFVCAVIVPAFSMSKSEMKTP